MDSKMKMFKTSIGGVETDFVFQQYRNKYLLIITQYQKMPNLYVASKELDMASEAGIMAGQNLSVQCKFGKDTDENRVGIKRILTGSKLINLRHDILVSLGLKEISKTILDEVINVLKTEIIVE